jgi:hypothetical protein
MSVKYFCDMCDREVLSESLKIEMSFPKDPNGTGKLFTVVVDSKYNTLCLTCMKRIVAEGRPQGE